MFRRPASRDQSGCAELLGLSAILAIMMITPAVIARAQTFTVIYNFSRGADGGQPLGTLVADKHGTLYGTTSVGGIQSPNCIFNGNGCGTVFKLTPSGATWSFDVLYRFAGAPYDGSKPNNVSLAFDKEGDIYGTTLLGGNLVGCENYGCGSVFMLAPDGQETILNSFHDSAGEAFMPDSGVVVSKNGSLFGATFHGGTYGKGTVYEVTSSGTAKVIYNFTGGADGGYPVAGLLLDKHGNLYGTTQYGGANPGCVAGCGTVFKVAPDGTETVLYSFAGGTDGYWPWAGVVSDKQGNLYGTTFVGGGSGCGGSGCGTVFKLTPEGRETVLHRFNQWDGAWPRGAGVILDAKGNLYGTTPAGGLGSSGLGTIFMLDPEGRETLLHSFTFSDGTHPEGGLVLGKNGVLYGTTKLGGANNQGTVFALNFEKQK